MDQQEDSTNVDGILDALHWSPVLATTTAAQRHWSVQGGSFLPDIEDHGERDLLADSAFRLFTCDPADEIYYNKRLFNVHAQKIIQHAGMVVHTLTDAEGPDAWGQVSFDTDVLTDRTEQSTNHFNGVTFYAHQVFQFFREHPTTEEYEEEVAFREANGIPFEKFCPMELWWQAGLMVLRETGFRVPYLRIPNLRSPLNKLLHWLDEEPARLNYLDEWALAFSESCQLAELSRGAKIGQFNDLLERGTLELKVPMVKRRLRLNDVTFAPFRKDVWPALVVPLVRRASELRDVGVDITECLWFTSAPVGSLSVPVEDITARLSLVATEHLKAERRLLGDTLAACDRALVPGVAGDLLDGFRATITTLDERSRTTEDAIEGVLEIIRVGHNGHATYQNTKPTFRVNDEDEQYFSTLERANWPHPAETEPPEDQDSDSESDDEEEIAEDVRLGLTDPTLSRGTYLRQKYMLENPVTWNLNVAPERDTALDAWQQACRADAHALTTGPRHRSFYSTITAIHLVLTTEEYARPGLIRHGLFDQDNSRFCTQEELYIKPEFKQAFGYATFEANLSAIAASGLRPAHADVWSVVDWDSLALDLAIILTLLLYSDRPYLYGVYTTMYIDSRCRELDLDADDLESIDTVIKAGVILGAIRDYAGGLTVAIGVESRSYNTYAPTRRYIAKMNHFMWTKHLIYLRSTFGYADNGPAGQSMCLGCPSTSHSRIRRPVDAILTNDRAERLTVGTATIRRGFKLDNTMGYARREHYACLVCLLKLRFHPTFIIIFHYFAHLTHQEDKAGMGKNLYIMTAGGPINAVTLSSMAETSA